MSAAFCFRLLCNSLSISAMVTATALLRRRNESGMIRRLEVFKAQTSVRRLKSPWTWTVRHLRTHQHNRTSGVDQWDHQMNQMFHWNWLRVASWEAFCYAQIDTRINWNCTSVSRFRATLTNPIGLRMEFSSLPSVTWESNLIRSIFHLLCTNNFQIIAINTNSARDSTLKWTMK